MIEVGLIGSGCRASGAAVGVRMAMTAGEDARKKNLSVASGFC